MDVVLWVAGTWLGLILLGYGLLWRRIAALTLKRPAHRVVEEEEVPGFARELLQAVAGGALAEGGFSAVAWYEVSGILRTPEQLSWGLLLADDAGVTWADVSLASMPAPGGWCEIQWLTLLQDGRMVATVNGLAHGIVGTLPDTVLLDPYSPTLEGQLAAHASAVGQEAARVGVAAIGRDDPTALLDNLDRRGAGLVEGLVSAGKVVPGQESGTWHLRAWPAAGVVGQIRRGGKRLKEMQVGRVPPATGASEEAQNQARVHAFLRSEAPPRRPSAARNAALLIVTMALAAASFAIWFDLVDLGLLLAVLLVHELGHLFAMKAFGYADTSIFFLPFFGAAATGTKPDASAEQRLTVAFMGPLPGLIVGIMLLLAVVDPPAELLKLAAMLVGLNWINLIPFLPLDGGHIASALVFSRNPRWESAFRLSGIAAFGLCAVFLEVPLLWILVVFGAVGFRSQTVVSAMLHGLRGERPVPADRRERLAGYFGWLAEHGGAAVPFRTLRARVRHAEVRGGVAPPGLGSTAGFALLYAALFLTPVLVWIAYFV